MTRKPGTRRRRARALQRGRKHHEWAESVVELCGAVGEERCWMTRTRLMCKDPVRRDVIRFARWEK